MEVSALKHTGAVGAHGRSPLLRLQSDERLVALIRRGNHHAFEALVSRYQSRLLAFCRHMLSSREDAEDVLQEVFAAAFNAMLADERPINVRPWLYRIARNRSLNHLRKATAIGVDSMDIHLAEHGQTTADRVHKREDFRNLLEDVGELAETQRTALLLREIDALSYDQIAVVMDTTVPSVKSLLVRARVSLAEAAEARLLSCEDVRVELGEVAEGLRRTSAPVRRHVRGCERCSTFRSQLKHNNKALAALFPVAPLLMAKKLLLAHLGTSAAAGGSSAAAGTAATAVGASTAAGAAGAAAGGLMQAGVATVVTKATAGLAAAAIVTAGAVEVNHRAHPRAVGKPAAAAVAPATSAAGPSAPAPVAVASAPQPASPAPTGSDAEQREAPRAEHHRDAKAAPRPSSTPTPAATPAATPTATPTAAPKAAAPGAFDHGADTTTLPTDQTGQPTPASTAPAAMPTPAPTAPPAATPTPAPAETPAPTPAAPTPAPTESAPTPAP